MSTQTVASRLAELCRQGQFEAAQKELFAEDAVSIEPRETPDFPKETKGLRAIIEKGHKFESMVEKVHGCTASSPLIAGEGTDHLRSPLILRVLHAGSLTVRQRRALVERGRLEYTERLVHAEEAAKSADATPASAPYARAVAEFAVAHNRAVLTLLDSVPTD